MSKSPITCHILDTTRGVAASEVAVKLEYGGKILDSPSWNALAEGKTDNDGRASQLLSPDYQVSPGIYKLTFYTKPYFESHGMKTFFPHVEVLFEIPDPVYKHVHVPLLLSPFSYSTYRGT